ncbi:MAG: hypothetical protein ABI431_02470 [Candidatus Tumulicola sp.]
MKFLVLVDDGGVPRWKRDCVDLLRDGNDVIVHRTGPVAKGAGEAAFAGTFGGRALQRVALRSPDAEITTGVDAILDLRSTPRFEPSPAARYGRWFFCDGTGQPVGELPGAREIAGDSSTFTVELRSYDGAGVFSLLRSGRFKSLYLYHRSMDVALLECARWPAIFASVHDALGGSPERRSSSPTAQVRRLRPVHFLLAVARQFVRHVFVNLFTDARWKVGTIQGSPARFLIEDYRPAIRWLPRESDDFLADPFVFKRDGRDFILGEALDPATRNGFIRCVELDGEGAVVDERNVMQAPTHLSYPFTFEHDGTWYMVPESAEERNIVLYRAVDAPYRWEPVTTMIENVAACDSTILRRDGRWWLFFTDKARDVNLNLFAYYADDLAGPWHAHMANPVKTDICSARPAGMPFEHDGDLYRPGQDCADGYGSAIAFSRVAKLTPHEYREELVSTFDSTATGAKTDGTHTMSYANDMVAIDAKHTVWASPRLIGQRLLRVASRAFRFAKVSYAR